MSTSYIIILSDSEDDYDNIPSITLLSDSDNESTPLEPMEGQQTTENVTIEMEDSEEEDPEEADPEEEEQSVQNTVNEETVSETSPPTFQNNYTSGPRVVRTARKRVPIPYQQRTTSPEASIPTIDPYINPASPTESNEHYHTKTWTWLPNMLKEWRKEEGFPTITEVGESSNARQDFPYTQEPPHHTVPLLVARMSTHEQRIEHVENSITGIQGTEEIEDLSDDVYAMGQNLNGLQERIASLEENLGDIGEATQEMLEKGQEHDSQTRRFEDRMNQLEQQLSRIEGRIDHLTALAAAAREYEAFIARGNHQSKKD